MEKAKKRVRPGNIVLLAITIILAFLFIYPVLFALLSAFQEQWGYSEKSGCPAHFVLYTEF